MSTPNNAETNSDRRLTRGAPVSKTAVLRLLDSLVGGIAAGAVFLVSLPALTEAANPLQSLAPTGLIFVLLFAWLFFWLLTTISRQLVTG